MSTRWILCLVLTAACGSKRSSSSSATAEDLAKALPPRTLRAVDPTPMDPRDYQRAKWNPIHFKPAITTATDEQCLTCHREVLKPSVSATSPAGVAAADALAWYQTVSTYQGDQETFHRRHLVTPYGQSVMQLRCTTCHEGNDPRDENGASSATAQSGLTLRKMVAPEICQMCHGAFPYQNMGVPGPWSEFGKAFNGNCLTCHAAIRTVRHRVNYLKADEIERLAATNSDVCYGCHGGRAWYRTSFPYPRHAWPGAPTAVPPWAKGRATESAARFLAPAPSGAPARPQSPATP